MWFLPSFQCAYLYVSVNAKYRIGVLTSNWRKMVKTSLASSDYAGDGRTKNALFLIKLETWQEVALIMTTYIKACFCRNSIMSSLDQGRRNVCKYGGLSFNPRSFLRRRCSFCSCQNLRERGDHPCPLPVPTALSDGWVTVGTSAVY